MDGIKNEFKGFEEGFEGFPKHLPDDCVEYSLFIIDSKLKSQKELLSCLEAVRKESVRLSDSLLKEYIWQRDGFKMEVKNEKGMPLQRVAESQLTLHRINVSSRPYELWRLSRGRVAYCIYDERIKQYVSRSMDQNCGYRWRVFTDRSCERLASMAES